MKRNIFKLSWLLMLALVLGFTACNTDDDNNNGGNNTILVEDGIYLKGEGTALTDLDSKGRLASTRNEVMQEERAELMEIYVAIKGNTDFNLIEVSGANAMNYGPAADFGEITGDALDGDEPTLGLWKGSYEETETAFQVPEDGLYHIIIDTELKKVAIAKVVWGVIGAATPSGWSASTQFTESAFDVNAITQEGVDIEMTKADYKFRYSNGWKIVMDADYDIDGVNKGIKVNTNFGGAADALVPGGDNIANDVPGIYKFTMSWSIEDGFTASVVKTGDATIKDYSETELGLIGSYLVAGEEMSAGWDSTILLTVPEQNNTVYTWRWSAVQVMVDSSFKVREGQTWDNMSVGFPQVTMAGSLADKFTTNADGNFVPTEDGTYDFSLTIDASTESYTFTAEPGGTPVPDNAWGLIGSSVPPYDWSEDVDMNWDYETNIWSITIDLVAGEIKFRADDDWALNYGDDGADGSLEQDGANIAIAEDGNYTIELILTDAENPTYTVTKN